MRRASAIVILFMCAQACTAGPERTRSPSATERSGPPDTIVLAGIDSVFPAGPEGASIRRGLAILAATRDSLPHNVGNRLRCLSCHLDEGRRLDGSTWLGVYARYPRYRARSGTVETLEFRINDCMERSMNGRALPVNSREMRDMVAYMAFLSRGVAVGQHVRGEGLPKLARVVGDSARGSRVFAARCAVCHGARGEGVGPAPPVWGQQSYNIGAGMSRIGTAASFIKYNMPLDRPGSLTEQEALDVATYVNRQPRRDYPGKELDWPNGDPPPDAAYETRAKKKHRF